MLNKEKFARGIIRLAGFALIIAAALLLVWSVVSRNEFLQGKYSEYQAFLGGFEEKIIDLESKWVIVTVIEILFLISSVFPLIPHALLFVTAGAVFPTHYALPIDIAGLCLCFSIKYYAGYRHGGGVGQRILRRNHYIQKIFGKKGGETPVTLFICRLLPFIPANQVSRIFGAIKFDYRKFIAISVLGYLPRMIPFNFVGRQIFDPFSFKFTTPLITVFFLSGVSMLAFNGIMEYIIKKEKK